MDSLQWQNYGRASPGASEGMSPLSQGIQWCKRGALWRFGCRSVPEACGQHSWTSLQDLTLAHIGWVTVPQDSNFPLLGTQCHQLSLSQESNVVPCC